MGTIEDETFNADGITLTIKGRSVHPGSAKNCMANATRIAADIVRMWPENFLPETTEQKEGFIHFSTIEASCEMAVVKGIAREHDLIKLKKLEKQLEAIVEMARVKYPLAEIKVAFHEQYRNMKEVIDKHPEIMKHVLAAFQAEQITPIYKPVRGGTDGARLSFMGLPTPNIFTGGSNYHGRFEWVSLDGMEKSEKVIICLVQEWEHA